MIKSGVWTCWASAVSLANAHIPAIFVVRIHGLLSLLHISCFCFLVSIVTRQQSRAAPTVPPTPRPQKRAAPAMRESHKANRSKSAARDTVPNADSHPPASEHPFQLVTVPIAGNDAAPGLVDIAAIVSEAVLGGLQAAGILPQA